MKETNNYFKVVRGTQFELLRFFDDRQPEQVLIAHREAVACFDALKTIADQHPFNAGARPRLAVYEPLPSPYDDVPSVGQWICDRCGCGTDKCRCRNVTKKKKDNEP
jgi:hypothetical protein